MRAQSFQGPHTPQVGEQAVAAFIRKPDLHRLFLRNRQPSEDTEEVALERRRKPKFTSPKRDEAFFKNSRLPQVSAVLV